MKVTQYIVTSIEQATFGGYRAYVYRTDEKGLHIEILHVSWHETRGKHVIEQKKSSKG